MEWNVKNPLTEALKNNEDGEGADHGRGAGGERHDDASQRRELAEDAHNLRRNKHQWCLFGCLFGCISVCVMRINQHFETIFACHYSNHSTNFATITMEREKTRPLLHVTRKTRTRRTTEIPDVLSMRARRLRATIKKSIWFHLTPQSLMIS